MAEVLRWTPLRHQILAKAAAGELLRTSSYAPDPVRITCAPGTSRLTGGQKRAAGELYRLRLVVAARRVSKSLLSSWVLDLAPVGADLLADWDREHPEVSGA